MNTEAIKKGFESSKTFKRLGPDTRRSVWLSDHYEQGPDSSFIAADANEAYRIFKEGYEQAVKDMEAESRKLIHLTSKVIFASPVEFREMLATERHAEILGEGDNPLVDLKALLRGDHE